MLTKIYLFDLLIQPTLFLIHHLEIKDFGSPTRGGHHDLFISKNFINNLKSMT